jgi:CO/xanthine dehydrogenase FAD-binding subunit
MNADYDLVIAESLSEVTALLVDPGWEGTELLAGGSNLLVDIRAGRLRPRRVVSLDRLYDLRHISENADEVVVGSSATVSDLLTSATISEHGPALVQASNVFAGLMVRNAATIGGNVACCSPAADLVPPLMALNAEVELVSLRGSRNVPLDSFYTGYKQDVRAPDEIISAIRWAKPKSPFVNTFYKLARRKGDAITIVGVSIFVSAQDGICDAARIAIGAASPVVLRAKHAEGLLIGKELTDGQIQAAAEAAANECNPVDDLRASAEYRLAMVKTLTGRLIEDARDDLKEKGALK